jgi:hypothetical protein
MASVKSFFTLVMGLMFLLSVVACGNETASETPEALSVPEPSASAEISPPNPSAPEASPLADTSPPNPSAPEPSASAEISQPDENGTGSSPPETAVSPGIAAETSESPEKAFFALQESVDNGHQPWRINPEEVAVEFATQTLNFEGTGTVDYVDPKETARVTFTKKSGEAINIDLYQPAVKGENGIWEVDCWFDENYRQHQVRDLTNLPPLFYNDENVPPNIREAVRAAVVKDWTDTFGVYYNVLGFYANNVTYALNGTTAEVTFLMTLVTQNFYKDPDTVEYIKDLKESGSQSYQQLYDEYNMPKSGNVQLKAVMTVDSSGNAVPYTMRIFHDISVKGEAEYVPVKAEDFIIKD